MWGKRGKVILLMRKTEKDKEKDRQPHSSRERQEKDKEKDRQPHSLAGRASERPEFFQRKTDSHTVWQVGPASDRSFLALLFLDDVRRANAEAGQAGRDG
jgi:hypothetical protein